MPLSVKLENLKADTAYTYTLKLADHTSREFSFHTQRAAGRSFTFTVQGDSHPERAHQLAPRLYAKVLADVATSKPDFYLLIGDDFSVDTPKNINTSAVAKVYTAYRPYLSIVGSSVPLFLINGNHEQAAKANWDGTSDNVAVWAQNARNLYYSQVAPDALYSSDTEKSNMSDFCSIITVGHGAMRSLW